MEELVKIRRARPDELEEIQELHKLITPRTPIVEDEEAFWWVAETGELLIGYAAMCSFDGEDAEGYLAISGVLTKYRGRGIQTRLIRARLKYARKLGWKTVATDTVAYNPRSINAIIRCGFKAFRPKVKWRIGECNYWIRKFDQ